MKSSSKLVFKYAILCDDVRREDNGKMMLIGIYGSDILLSSPTKLMLNMMVSFDVLQVGTYVISIELFIDGKKQNSGVISITAKKANNSLGAFPVPLAITKSCLVEIYVSEGKNKPTKILTMPVRVG